MNIYVVLDNKLSLFNYFWVLASKLMAYKINILCQLNDRTVVRRTRNEFHWAQVGSVENMKII